MSLHCRGVKPTAGEAIFLTHFHSDHIDGLGELMLQRWGGGAANAPVFEHIIPPVPFEALEGPWLSRSRHIFHGKVRVGRDGDFLSLPVGTTEIRRTNRLKTFQ